jgi:hypothetical protein
MRPVNGLQRGGRVSIEVVEVVEAPVLVLVVVIAVMWRSRVVEA